MLLASYVASFAQVGGYVRFVLRGDVEGCSPYMYGLNGSPIVGAEVHGSTSGYLSGTSVDFTNPNGAYGVAPPCDKGEWVTVNLVSPRVQNHYYKAHCEDDYDFNLEHPEEATFSMNGMPQSYWNSYDIIFCGNDPKVLSLDLLGGWLEYGTMYRLKVWKSNVFGSPIGTTLFTSSATGLSGLPSTISLAGFLTWFYANDQDLDGHYYVELEVGNCNGWKPIKGHADFRVRDLTVFSGLKFKPTAGHPPIPVTNSSCSSPLDISWYAGAFKFNDVVGTVKNIHFRIEQYNSNCVSTGKVLDGITLNVNKISDLELSMVYYTGLSLNPDNSNSEFPNGSPNNSTTGTNFYLDDGYASGYIYKVEVMTSNGCQSTLSTFWLHPNEFKQAINDGLDKISLVSNPVSDELNFSLSLSEDYPVSLSIYNSMGQQVLNRAKQQVLKGSSRLRYNVLDLGSGVYFYKFYSDSKVLKMGKFVKN